MWWLGTMFRFRERRISGICTRENDVATCPDRCFNGGTFNGSQCICPAYLSQTCCLTKRCSWRPDSRFCYPGTCPGDPSTCVCAEGFSGPNCLRIDTNPTIDQCTGTFTRSGVGYLPSTLDCSTGAPQYCPIAAESVVVDWVTSFVPDLSNTETPAYVNDTVFGIINAELQLTLKRGHITIDSGSSKCVSFEDLNIDIFDVPLDEVQTRNCEHTITITAEINHNDLMEIIVIATNGGFIRLNNFDIEGVVTLDPPREYETNYLSIRTEVHFDFLAPYHCGKPSMSCGAYLLDIGNPYRKTEIVDVKWVPTDWHDDLGGLSHYKCESYRLTAGPDGKLEMNVAGPYQVKDSLPLSSSFVNLIFNDRGVYAIILSVFDKAGNAAKVRRFLVYDNQNSTEIDNSAPITAREATHYANVNWLAVEQGKIKLTWNGHFVNNYYKEGKLLNEIEEMPPPLDDVYDEETGQPPSSRSREAIPNADGLTKFEVGLIQTSARDKRDVEPTTWLAVPAPAVSEKLF
ncbi:uncharacterized protein [Ptychodera flava]|uniref:uncharacterized protein n=1 Tax=Ptychodera flava TaxID=63121 RepID=UPI003969E801